MAAFANSLPIVTSGLVLYLDAANMKSYPKSGTAWNDLSRNNNNGTLVNGPIYSSNDAGSILFDGVNDYTSFSTTNLVVNTISIWMYLKNNNNGPIIYSGVDTFNSGLWEWSIYMLNSTMYFRGNSGDLGAVNYPSSNYLNVWKNFTLIRNFNSRFYLYENGVYKNDSTDSSSNNTNQLRFCKADTNYANVNIANLQIYNRALTATEVLQNYNAQKSRFGL